jgi:hypothetical protein
MDKHNHVTTFYCTHMSIISELSLFIYCYKYMSLSITNFHFHFCMVVNLSINCIKCSSVSNMLILTYFGLAPNCLPLLVKILCPRRKLSQSSISPSHFNQAKAARNYKRLYEFISRNENLLAHMH